MSNLHEIIAQALATVDPQQSPQAGESDALAAMDAPLSDVITEAVGVFDRPAAPAGQADGSKPTNPKDAIGIRKAPMSVVPALVLAELGVAMLEGSAKYGRFNYRCAGVRASVYYDATMRHLMAWWEGQDTDPDSGLSHITKAIASLVVLRDAMMNDRCTDDRPPSVDDEFWPILNGLAGKILDRHADKAPRHYTIEDTGLQIETGCEGAK